MIIAAAAWDMAGRKQGEEHVSLQGLDPADLGKKSGCSVACHVQ